MVAIRINDEIKMFLRIIFNTVLFKHINIQNTSDKNITNAKSNIIYLVIGTCII